MPNRGLEEMILSLDCLMWCLWRKRNARLFEDSERNVMEIRMLFLRTLYEWMMTTDLFSFSNLLDFIDECNFCA